jgi:outer membrane receptor protein involved in Fe transport
MLVSRPVTTSVLLLAATALASGTLGLRPAQAQSASGSDKTPATVAEVVVTAQKRPEKIQDVPQTISVVGSRQLEDFHVTQLTDIGAYVPGLQVDTGGTPGQTTLSMRGIAPISANATVASYIDDTPIGSTSFHNRGSLYSLDLLPYDVQQIEVLEGPQGTLYGANALGGIVRYVTTQPSLTTFGARVGGDVESIDGGGVGGGARAMINAPLVADTLGFLASYAFENTPGYIDNIRTGQSDQNAVRQQSARLALLWRINEDATLKLGVIYQHENALGNATVALDPGTLRPFAELSDNNYLSNTFRSTLQYYTADLNWNFGWAKLVAASSYSDQKTEVDQDATLTYQPILGLFGFPDGLSAFDLALRNKKFTQELRLSSPSNGKFEWLVGAYYDHENSGNRQTLTSQNPDLSPIPGLDPLFIGALPTTYQELAGFGDATYYFSKWFDISAGVRYAHNTQKFTEIIEPGSPVLPPAEVPGSSSEGVWTYSVSPRLHFTRDIMAYARVASGYQPGGPNTALPGVPPAVNSSTLTNYEVGLKSTFWDGRAVLNLSAFDLEWKNIQVAGESPGGVSYTTNGGTARSRGFEAEGSVRPADGWQLAANVTYTDAAFTEDVASVGAFSGDRLPFVPRWSGAIRADYDWSLSADWRGHVGTGLRLVDSRYSPGPLSVNEFPTRGYTSLDLNADVSNDRYTVRVFVKNLTNERAYLTDGYIPDGLTGGVVQVEGAVLQPRTIGLSIDVKY